jgi:hypothetical protein
MKRVKINEVKSNPNNPRVIKDEKFQKLVQSLKDFPDMAEVRPIVVNTDMIVLGGNMRLKAMKEAGWKDVPIEIVDWPEDKQREFVIKDNVGYGEWDWELIVKDWPEAEEWGLDVPKNNIDDTYTTKIESPIYTPKGEKPDIKELYNLDKYNKILKKIKESNINEEIKQYLEHAASRHIEFNYAKAAEYYSHSDNIIKELFEDSALIIIDYDDAIQKGFVELFETLDILSNE